MPPELAWIFATRPVFLHPELLPCVNLDPDLYCPRRTAAFTAAEDWYLLRGGSDRQTARQTDRCANCLSLQPPGSGSQEHGWVM